MLELSKHGFEISLVQDLTNIFLRSNSCPGFAFSDRKKLDVILISDHIHSFAWDVAVLIDPCPDALEISDITNQIPLACLSILLINY